MQFNKFFVVPFIIIFGTLSFRIHTVADKDVCAQIHRVFTKIKLLPRNFDDFSRKYVTTGWPMFTGSTNKKVEPSFASVHWSLNSP